MCEGEIEIENPEKYTETALPILNEIETLHVNDLSYNEFFDRFMARNIPVLITGIADRWECMNWADKSASGINFEYLRQKIISSQDVPIADCNKAHYNSHEKFEMKFNEFVDYWMGRQQTVDAQSDSQLFYLKDWHLRRSQPDYEFYKTPTFFASDWLNEYCEEKKTDDYRFVYMGPKGTWTPFHCDVFLSFSWSTNIVGIKKWIFFAPNEEKKLRDRFGNIPFGLSGQKYQTIIKTQSVPSFEVIQGAGQTVFVPSGWHHQVWNLEDTISVNHNWFNGCNIHYIWSAIFEKYNEVVREIDDCRDMDNFDEHCQLMLKADFGLDFHMFLDVIDCIVINRLKILQSSEEVILNGCKLGSRHALFDLMQIRLVMEDFIVKCPLEELKSTSQKIIAKIHSFV